MSRSLLHATCLVPLLLFGSSATLFAQIREQAIVDLTFDEPEGDAKDRATKGSVADVGTFGGGARRVPSPFWNQSGKRAVILDGTREQYVAVADGADVDRTGAVTGSLFFLNLMPPNSTSFVGLFAKRVAEPPSVTNYGINFGPKADNFQVYVNDGSGYRVVQFPFKATIGTRRLAHVTATWEVADAPGADADTDADDVRVRLFVNGAIVKPKHSKQGFVVGNDGWLTDVAVDKWLNDTPLTIGSTNTTQEFASGVVDEFLLFDKALTPEEAKTLFTEVAGPNAVALAKQEGQPVPGRALPVVNTLSQHGLEIGKTTRLTFAGGNLAGGQLVIPGVDFTQKTVTGSNAGRLIVDVTPTASVVPQRVPVHVVTPSGVSNAAALSFDRLPHGPATVATTEAPARLPAAFEGTVSGAQSVRVFFHGKAGERVVADVESRRLGAKFDPVVEIKTQRGTPLAVEWTSPAFAGDARAEVTLPTDGLYFAEVHDLAYKAPGRNPFVLRVGDLQLVDRLVAAKTEAGQPTALIPIGSGTEAVAAFPVTIEPNDLDSSTLVPAATALAGHAPLPPLRNDADSFAAEGDAKIDARFTEPNRNSLVIAGRLAERGETDRHVVDVTPGHNLRIAVLGRAIDSPIDAVLSLHAVPAGNQLAYAEDAGASRDPAVNYKVPGNVKQIEIRIRDLASAGGPRHAYRVRVSKNGLPSFTVATTDNAAFMPRGGATVVPLKVTRAGYNGSIRLASRDATFAVFPEELPAGANGPAFVTLTAKDPSFGGTRFVELVAESVGVTPAIRQRVTVAMRPNDTRLAGDAIRLPVTIVDRAAVSVAVAELPAQLFKGTDPTVAVTVTLPEELRDGAVRLSLLSTEAKRLVNPKDAKQGNKPLVRVAPGQDFWPGTASGPVRVLVPVDVAQASLDFVLKAEVVPHPYSNDVRATGVSAPFRLAVKQALTATVDAGTLELVAESENVLKGALKRTAGFSQPVRVSLAGLPAGYVSPPVTVPGDASTFELKVTAPKEAKPRPLPKITLRVTTESNRGLSAAVPVALKVKPKPAAE